MKKGDEKVNKNKNKNGDNDEAQQKRKRKRNKKSNLKPQKVDSVDALVDKYMAKKDVPNLKRKWFE